VWREREGERAPGRIDVRGVTDGISYGLGGGRGRRLRLTPGAFEHDPHFLFSLTFFSLLTQTFSDAAQKGESANASKRLQMELYALALTLQVCKSALLLWARPISQVS